MEQIQIEKSRVQHEEKRKTLGEETKQNNQVYLVTGNIVFLLIILQIYVVMKLVFVMIYRDTICNVCMYIF